MASADSNLSIKVTADVDDAIQRMHDLYDAAEPVSQLLEVKRDWWPYVLGLAGWAFGLVEWFTR
jgi:hypothetical protein